MHMPNGPTDWPANRHLCTCTRRKRISVVSCHNLVFHFCLIFTSVSVRRSVGPSVSPLVIHFLYWRFISSYCTPLMHKIRFILLCFNGPLESEGPRKKVLKMVPHAVPCFSIFCLKNVSSQNFLHSYCRQDIIVSWSNDIQTVPAHLTTSCYSTYIFEIDGD